MKVTKTCKPKLIVSSWLALMLVFGMFPVLAFANDPELSNSEQTVASDIASLLVQQDSNLQALSNSENASAATEAGSLSKEITAESDVISIQSPFSAEPGVIEPLLYLPDKKNDMFLTGDAGITTIYNNGKNNGVYGGPISSGNSPVPIYFAAGEYMEVWGFGTEIKQGSQYFHYLPVSYLIYTLTAGVESNEPVQIITVDKTPEQANWNLAGEFKKFKLNKTGDYRITALFYLYSEASGSVQLDTNNQAIGDFRTVDFTIIKDISKDSRATVLAGAGRHETASKIVAAAYPNTVSGVIIAAGYGHGNQGKFADALAASALAGLLDYPILLTDKDALPKETKAALNRLKPTNIIVLGDNNSVSKAVRTELSKISTVKKVDQIYGNSRIETALAIYNYGKKVNPNGWSKTAIFANSMKFPDALAISPYSNFSQSPIFLVNGNKLDAATAAAVKSGGFTDAIIVGSKDSVSNSIATEIQNIIKKAPVRKGGANRYETAKLIAEYSVQKLGMNYNEAGIATGANFPDALVAGPLLGKRGAVLLLAADGEYDAVDSLGSNKASISKVHFFGDTKSSTQSVRNRVAVNLGWT